MASAVIVCIVLVAVTERPVFTGFASGLVGFLGFVLVALAALCEEIDKASTSPKEPFAAPPGVPAGATLYIKSRCGFSRATLLAMDNLHLSGKVPVRNVTEDPAAKATLLRIAGKETAPCLIVGETPMHESKDIIRRLVDAVCPL